MQEEGKRGSTRIKSAWTKLDNCNDLSLIGIVDGEIEGTDRMGWSP